MRHARNLRSSLRRAVTIPLAATLLLGAGCTNPRAQAAMAQALNDAAIEMSAMRQDMALLQEQIDSLKNVLARQDTAMQRIANVLGGVPLPPP